MASISRESLVQLLDALYDSSLVEVMDYSDDRMEECQDCQKDKDGDIENPCARHQFLSTEHPDGKLIYQTYLEINDARKLADCRSQLKHLESSQKSVRQNLVALETQIDAMKTKKAQLKRTQKDRLEEHQQEAIEPALKKRRLE